MFWTTAQRRWRVLGHCPTLAGIVRFVECCRPSNIPSAVNCKFASAHILFCNIRVLIGHGSSGSWSPDPIQWWCKTCGNRHSRHQSFSESFWHNQHRIRTDFVGKCLDCRCRRPLPPLFSTNIFLFLRCIRRQIPFEHIFGRICIPCKRRPTRRLAFPFPSRSLAGRPG